jgi:hypothetical protein
LFTFFLVPCDSNSGVENGLNVKFPRVGKLVVSGERVSELKLLSGWGLEEAARIGVRPVADSPRERAEKSTTLPPPADFGCKLAGLGARVVGFVVGVGAAGFAPKPV